MKYGEDVIKLFQEYVDNNTHPQNEYRMGVIKDGKIIGVYGGLEEAINETLKTEKLNTFNFICFHPIVKEYPIYGDVNLNI